eukprot:820462-Prymnesium_polylepis.2
MRQVRMQRGGYKPENHPLSTEFQVTAPKLRARHESWPHAGPGCAPHFWFMTVAYPGSCHVPIDVCGLQNAILVSDQIGRNSKGPVPDLQNGGVLRGRQNGAELAFRTRFFDLDSASTTVSKSVPV